MWTDRGGLHHREERVRPGLLRLLPLPLGLVGGLLGGVLWWVVLLFNPDFWNDLDEIEAYVVLGTIYAGWGLLIGVFFALVPPFRSENPARDGVRYRVRRTIWLYTIPVLALWGATIGVVVALSQRAGYIDEEILVLLIMPLCMAGTAWVCHEVTDWLRPILPPPAGTVIAAGAIVVLSLSLGTILILTIPYLFQLFVPNYAAHATVMDAALDFLDSDLEIYSVLMLVPAVHGGILAVMVPACEALWEVPPPRRRDLGNRPYLLLLLPVIAIFDLMAVIFYAR